MSVVITGTGRCGTRYMWKLLRACGLIASHEGLYGIEDQASEKYDARQIDVSWMAPPSLPRRSVSVAQLTRHPRDVVASLVGIGFFDDGRRDLHGRYRAFAERYAPMIFKLSRDPVTRSVAWWVLWNRQIEWLGPLWRIKAEQVPPAFLVAVGATVGKPVTEVAALAALDNTPRDVNHRQRAQADNLFDNVPERLLGEMSDQAARYGYGNLA